MEPPEWLLTTKSILLSKTDQTRNPQNYRPIALQNTMYKIYTVILAEFVTDHCEENKIITEEQAVAKRKSWGCIDQLLINKTVYDDVKKNRKNLCTAWLDYKKAYDNVPHSWIIESLRLAKIPQKIIGAISDLMHKWRTKVYLYGETSSIETNFIDYLRGILQGDTPNLLLFALSVNPLSYLLSKEDGFKLAVGKLKQNLSHLFLIDDLKLFTTTRDKLLKLLGIVTQFSNDV